MREKEIVVAKMVKIKHPKVDAVGTCSERALAHWKSLGWSPVDDDPAQPKDTSDTPAGADEDDKTDAGQVENATASDDADDPESVDEKPARGRRRSS